MSPSLRTTARRRPAQGGPPRRRVSPAGTGLRFAVVLSRYNEFIGERLLEGALSALAKHGVDASAVAVVRVPGAFELPLIAKRLAASGRYDAVICLGAVLRGETPHFDFVAGEAARGIARASFETGVPVLFGVLTANTLDQALDRAGGKHGNKGAEVAQGAVEMATLVRSLPKKGSR